PPGRAGQQAVVQHLAVVARGVSTGHEVRADPELLQHDRAAEGPGQLALPGRRVVLAHLVVADRVHMRAKKVTQPRGVREREPCGPFWILGSPSPVAEREGLVAACGAYRVPDDLGPGGNDLPRCAAAVQRHL